MALLLRMIICSSFLHLLTPSLLQTVRDCLSKKSTSYILNCDNQIYRFLKASNSAANEVFSLFKPEDIIENPSEFIPGVQTGILRLSSSSTSNSGANAGRARMNLSIRESSDCWCAHSSSTEEFIQASSSFPVVIHSIQTKSCSNDMRITKMKIIYTIDGRNWINYNNAQEFEGNLNSTAIINIDVKPFLAKSLRILPVAWNLNVCTKIEVQITKINYDPLPPRKSDQIWIAAISSGFNVFTSSIYDPNYGISNSIIDFRSLLASNAWCAGFNSTDQYIAISSPEPVTWNQLTIQGASQGILVGKITKFRVSYTLDGVIWTDYNNNYIFAGNYDTRTTILMFFKPSFSALAVKVYALEWSGSLCIRLEAFCSKINRLS